MITPTIILTSLLLANPVEPVKKPPALAEAASLKDSNNAFALDLLCELSGERGNVFFSPWSVETALGMSLTGTGSGTSAQRGIAGAMRLTVDPSKVGSSFASLSESMKPGDNVQKKYAPIFTQANRLWHTPTSDLKVSYRDGLFANFGAKSIAMPFEDKDAVARSVNGWVKDETRGMIPVLISASDVPTDGFILCNAIYFKGHWVTPFNVNATKDGSFTLADGKVVQTPLMHITDDFVYGQLPHAQFCTLPYHGDWVMDVILPDEGMMQTTITKLDGEQLNTIATKGYRTEVNLTLPKFEAKTHQSLLAILSKMGLSDATIFSKDFTAATDQPARISEIVHAAVIKVDEKGTEAAAASGVMGTTGSPVPPKIVDFKVDRPFVLMIRHRPSGTVTFAGWIDDPR